MTAVTVSPKYQVVIPKEIREAMDIHPGQKIHVMVYKGRIELIPLQPMEKMRGFASDIETDFEREKDRL